MFRPLSQTLRHIHVEFNVCQDDPYPLPQLAPEFASLVGNNSIENIKISMIIHIPTDEPGDEWGALESVFTQSEAGWAKLQRLSLHIAVIPEYPEDDEEELLDVLRELPKTQRKGLAESDNFLFDFYFTLAEPKFDFELKVSPSSQFTKFNHDHVLRVVSTIRDARHQYYKPESFHHSDSSKLCDLQ